MNYYETLKVSPFASNEEITKAHSKLVSNNLTNEEKIDIDKAFNTLNDYHSRTVYDDQIKNEEEIEGLNKNLNNLSSEPVKIFEDENNNIFNLTNSKSNNTIENMLVQIMSRLDNIEKK